LGLLFFAKEISHSTEQAVRAQDRLKYESTCATVTQVGTVPVLFHKPQDMQEVKGAFDADGNVPVY
jgi:hypothetical protein